MKKNVLVFAMLMVAMLFSSEIAAQRFSMLRASPLDRVSYNNSETGQSAKVMYSRPQLKGRRLSRLIPEGKVWRTGANEATLITFSNDVVFGGTPVKAGTYSLFTIPGKSTWTVILNSETKLWGTNGLNEEKNVAKVQGEVTSSVSPIEAFSIAFDKEMNLYLGWGYTIVKVTVKG